MSKMHERETNRLVWVVLLIFAADLCKVCKATPRRQLLAQSYSALSTADLAEGGSCGSGDGCRREAVSARAKLLGAPLAGEEDCEVAEGNVGNGFNVGDTSGATLGVVHWCQNATGELLAQVWITDVRCYHHFTKRIVLGIPGHGTDSLYVLSLTRRVLLFFFKIILFGFNAYKQRIDAYTTNEQIIFIAKRRLVSIVFFLFLLSALLDFYVRGALGQRHVCHTG